MIPNLIGPLIAVGIWQIHHMSAFAVIMVMIALSTTIFGYRVTFGEQEPDTSSKIEALPYNAVTVFGQLFKNKALCQSGCIMILTSIVFGAVNTFIPLYAVRDSFVHAGLFLTIQAIAVVLSRFYLRKYIPSDGQWHSVLCYVCYHYSLLQPL